MNFDRLRFFASYRIKFGMGDKPARLNQSQVDGLLTLLDHFEVDAEMTDIRWIAYCLATTKHETADTYQPIEEYGRGKGRTYGTPDSETSQIYYGRGYTQNTWKTNYTKLTAAWNKLNPDRQIDFIHHPELLLQPEYAYLSMSYGMRTGLYTWKKLSDYINKKRCDYTNARRIINVMDRAETIAGYAMKFQKVLEGSLI
jgi:hypothetical protein